MKDQAKLRDIVAKNVYRFRKDAKLTQEELAKRANIASSTIARIETNSKAPSLDLCDCIADALQCNSVDLFVDIASENKRSKNQERI